ncbi:cytochrome P450 [Jongsikchunia kroppenstedtii]|uniref:cytochrome P450 n=1 Tax=Jongsikchunia kroppenstedtii TaxID=1121721 RepID=UPI00036FB709|nr:cytochrome P450 [Jongsikchunia kroppenstedtii]
MSTGLTRRQIAMHWVRWLPMHGLARVAIRQQAKRGAPLAQFIRGDGGTENPYPVIERIREYGHISRTAVGAVSADYTVVRDVLRDSRFVTVSPQNVAGGPVVRRIFDMTDPGLSNPVEPPSMLAVDPPEHTRFRKLVSRAFTPRAINALDDRIQEVTDELLAGFTGQAHADLVQDFAARLPVAIIAQMLSVPLESTPNLLKWGGDASPLLDIGITFGTYKRASDSLLAFDEFLGEHIAQLRADGNSDAGILGTIVNSDDLTLREQKATAALLLGAGFETTVNLIGNGIVALQNNPDQLQLLRDDPELWPNAIEEVLRYDSPVQVTGRIPTEDVEIAGLRLRKGRMIVLLLGGANRDPNVFENPNTFDVTRDNAREHVAFSSGVHACLGASLARKEGVIALRALFENYPELALSGPPVHRGLINLHGYEHLPAALGQRVRVVAA